MKTLQISAHRSPVQPSVRHIALILGATLFGLGAITVSAQVSELDIDVRAAVPDKSFDVSTMSKTGKQGRVYGILAVQMISSEEQLVKPVNARGLMGLVCNELDSHGFTQVTKGGRPDILITVQYGRAWLWNPYYGKNQPIRIPGGPDGGSSPVRTLTMGDASEFTRLRKAGMEAKAQKADLEKLCIKLTAWENLKDPKATAHQVWSTTIVVDDPAHRDLNAIAAEMLAAGSPYFGREIKEEEIEIVRPLPEGHVNVGTPEVVAPKK